MNPHMNPTTPNESFGIPTKAIVLGGGAIALGLAGWAVWYFYLREKSSMKEVASLTTSIRPAPKAGGFQCKSSTYPLNKYTCHPDVGRLQAWLNRVNGSSLTVDNKFGDKTEKAALAHTGRTAFDKPFIDTLILRT